MSEGFKECNVINVVFDGGISKYFYIENLDKMSEIGDVLVLETILNGVVSIQMKKILYTDVSLDKSSLSWSEIG